MSDEAPETTEPAPQGDPAELGDAGKKALAAEREARAKAEKLANEYKARLDEIEQANLSEIEKAQKRAEAAEQELAAARVESLRLSVAAKHGLSGDHLDLLVGSTEEELEAKATKLASLIKPQRGPIVPSAGDIPDNSKSPDEAIAREFARDFFQG